MVTRVDEVEIEDDGGRFEFVLSFAGATCAKCGTVGVPGRCETCGAEVPDTTGENEAVRARRAALLPLLQDAEAIFASYGAIGEAHVPVASEQYVSTLTDTQVTENARRVIGFPRRSQTFDLNDPQTVGGAVRRAVVSHLDELRALRREIEEFAWFVPPHGLEAVRDGLLTVGRRSTEVAVSVLRMWTSTTYSEAQRLEAETQMLLDDLGPFDLLSETLDAYDHPPPRDLDDRAMAAFGPGARVTDDLGAIEPARVFAATTSEGEEPFAALARRAGGYFEHLLERPGDELAAEKAFLILPAVVLACLDRPLPAHRLARASAQLMGRAWAADATATRERIEQTTAQGARLFASATRMQNDIRYLASGQASDAVEVLDRLVSTYKRLAESGFRTHAALLLDLHDLAAGRTLRAGSMPLLGELEDRIEAGAADDPALAELRGAVRRDLRNAEGHEDYWVDAESLEVVLPSEERLDLAGLEAAFERLGGTVAGLEAGFGCFVVNVGIELPVPDWLSENRAPLATELLATAALAAYGFDLVEVRWAEDALEVLVDHEQEPDRAALLPPLAGLAVVFSGVQVLRVHSRVEDRELIEVKAAAFADFLEAPDGVKDLAVFVPLQDAARRAGRSDADALGDALAMCVAVLMVVDVPRIAEWGEAGFTDLVARLTFIQRRVVPKPWPRDRRLRKALDHLTRATAAARAAQLGGPEALDRLARHLGALGNWVEARGVQWPPL